MSLRDYFAVPTVEGPMASPDGERVAVLYDRTGRPEVHVVDLRTPDADPVRVTDGELRGHAFAGTDVRWAADGEGVYVLRVPDDDPSRTELAWLPVDAGDRGGGTADAGDRGRPGTRQSETLAEFGDLTRLLAVHPAGEELLFADVANDRTPSAIPYRFDLASGERRRLAPQVAVRRAWYGPEGDPVVYAGADPGSGDARRQRVYAVETGGDPRVVAPEGVGPVDRSPDGRHLLVDDLRGEQGIGVVDLDAGRDGGPGADDGTSSVRWIDGSGGAEEPVGFLRDGDVLAIREGTAVVHHVGSDEPEGKSGSEDSATTVLGSSLPGGAVESAAAIGNRAVLVTEGDDERPGALLRWDPTAGTGASSTRRLLCPEYGAVEPPEFPDPERVTFEGADGAEREAYYFDPDPARETPAVVWVYGYVAAPYFVEEYRPGIRALLDRGYAVALPGNRPDPYGEATADFAAAGRWLAEREGIDGDRVAVFGHSHGGYCALVGADRYPDVWAAAVARNAPTDLPALDEYRGAPPDLREHLPDPEENPETWQAVSPACDPDPGCPVLVLQAEHDDRVPPSQAERYREALRAAGFEEGEDFEFAVLEEQWHFTHDADARTKTWRRILDFLDRRL